MPMTGSAGCVLAFGKAEKADMLKQHDRLGVGNLAAGDAGKGGIEGHLDDLDVLALMPVAAAVGNAVGRRIRRREAGDPFGDATRAHEGVEDTVDRAQPVAEFLLGFLADRRFGVEAVEHAGAGFDEVSVMSAQEGRDTELAYEKDRAALRVEGQEG